MGSFLNKEKSCQMNKFSNECVALVSTIDFYGVYTLFKFLQLSHSRLHSVCDDGVHAELLVKEALSRVPVAFEDDSISVPSILPAYLSKQTNKSSAQRQSLSCIGNNLNPISHKNCCRKLMLYVKSRNSSYVIYHYPIRYLTGVSLHTCLKNSHLILLNVYHNIALLSTITV